LRKLRKYSKRTDALRPSPKQLFHREGWEQVFSVFVFATWWKGISGLGDSIYLDRNPLCLEKKRTIHGVMVIYLM
jgi:hypothetical protein